MWPVGKTKCQIKETLPSAEIYIYKHALEFEVPVINNNFCYVPIAVQTCSSNICIFYINIVSHTLLIS